MLLEEVQWLCFVTFFSQTPCPLSFWAQAEEAAASALEILETAAGRIHNDTLTGSITLNKMHSVQDGKAAHA